MVTTTKISAGTIYKHPDDDRLYYMDFTAELDEDELIQSVASANVEDGTGATIAGELTVDAMTLTPNPVAFKNSQNKTVAIGKAALFRVDGGVDGADYYVQINVVTDQPNNLSRVAIFQVRGR